MKTVSENGENAMRKRPRNILSGENPLWVSYKHPLILLISILLLISSVTHSVASVTIEGTTYAWVKDPDNVLTLEIPVPAGAVDGDLLILFQGTSGKKPDEPVGNGGAWTLIGHANKANENNDDPYGNCSLHAYYKIYDSGGGDTVTYTRGNRKFAQLVLVRGSDTGNPVVDFGFVKSSVGSISNGDDGDFEAASVDTEFDGALLVSIQFDDKVLMRKIEVGGAEIPILIFNQRGDDTSVLGSDENTDGTPTGPTRYYWTGNDDRKSMVYAIAMSLSLRYEGVIDNDPPTPDPAAFTSAPVANNGTAISMTAVGGTDISGPVEYYFAETSGNPGGSDSGWQVSPSYTDRNLDPLTTYSYTVTMRDSKGNVGGTSAPDSATTPEFIGTSGGDDFNDNVYSGWTEINFTDGDLPIYKEQNSRLEWGSSAGGEDDHVALYNSSDHGQDLTINVDVTAMDGVGTFYVYFFYQDDNNWYRLNVNDGSSSVFEKCVSGSISQIGLSGLGVDIGNGDPLRTWEIIVSNSGRLQFISEGSTLLNESDALIFNSGTIGLGGVSRRPVWDNFSFISGGGQTGPTATAISTNQINLIWSDFTNETSYTLFRSTINNTNNATNIMGFLANMTNYSNMGLLTDTTYYYWIKAYNADGSSGFSSIASNRTWPSIPLTPAMLSISAVLSNRIDLVWENLANESSYTLFRDTDNDPTGAVKIGRAANQTNINNTGLGVETTYYYWVKAYNISGSSGYSTIVSNTTWPSKPLTPAILSITVISSNQIDLVWENVSKETSYTLFRDIDNDPAGAVKIHRLANQTNFSNTGLNPGTTYYYWVRAYNISGSLGYSTFQSNTTLPSIPLAPLILSISDNSSDQIYIAWENLNNEASYTLFRSETNNVGSATNKFWADVDVTNYTDTGLKIETAYYYWVKAYNISGESPYSSVASNIITLTTPFNGGTVKIGPTTLFGNEKLYFANVTEETKVSIYNIKRRLLWTADVTDSSKCIPQAEYLYIKPEVIEDLVDGLYIIIFKNDNDEPQIRKFNRITRTRQ